MPSKKPSKPVKKPFRPAAKKAVASKASAPKKAVRSAPGSNSKVKVKSTKSVLKAPVKAAVKASAKASPLKSVATKVVPLKPVAAPKVVPVKLAAAPKVVPVKPAAKLKTAEEKSAPIKFDPRPLVVSRPSSMDDDADSDGPVPASLLAGPRNVKPYISRRGEQYMNKEQLQHFSRILRNWKRDLMVEVDRTVLHMKDEAANFPDPNDRATQEEEFSLELRTRDRERKLIRKIDEALKRTEDGSYGYCLETGEEIGIKRLEARPVATLSVEAQERRERREKQYGDRDDRYR